jgi:hypothetical protein
MSKPTYDELKEMLERLLETADNCIPSDECSNSQLALADEVITEAHALLARCSDA